MKQKLIVSQDANAFGAEVNELLADGWYYIPDTLKVTSGPHGERFVMMLIQDEEHDEIVAAVKQSMSQACGCGCGDPHDGPKPPPFFQCPNEEPQSDDGLTSKQ